MNIAQIEAGSNRIPWHAINLALRGWVCALFCASAWCASAQPEAADLSDDDLDAVQALFLKMGDAFLRGDAKAMKNMLSESNDRDTLAETLKREFKEAKYLDFQVERPIRDPDNRMKHNRYSVDVTIRLKLLYLDDSRRPDERKPIENTTFQNFIVQRETNHVFRIVSSSFFDNMGRRRGGMGWLVEWIWFLMLACLALVLWVWAASEALWMRPKSRLWRAIAFVPVLGSLIFIFVKYVPGLFRQKDGEQRARD